MSKYKANPNYSLTVKTKKEAMLIMVKHDIEIHNIFPTNSQKFTNKSEPYKFGIQNTQHCIFKL